MQIAHINDSQVYEWLPYTENETVPEGEEERYEWLKGMDTTKKYTDKEIMALKRGYAVRYAKTAARFRKELIKTYGKKRGSKIRFAEAYQICEYGSPMTEEIRKILEEA
jgi:hypothetical protein